MNERILDITSFIHIQVTNHEECNHSYYIQDRVCSFFSLKQFILNLVPPLGQGLAPSSSSLHSEGVCNLIASLLEDLNKRFLSLSCQST